jgi:hypothetical protein
MKLLLMGTGRYLYKVYNYHDNRACGYKRSGILPRIVGMVWNGVVFVEICDPFVPFVPL